MHTTTASIIPIVEALLGKVAGVVATDILLVGYVFNLVL